MEATTELPEKADTAPHHSSTLSHTNATQPGTVMPKVPTTSPSTARRKSSTKSAPPFSMKRAASTPNVRTVAGAEVPVVSMAEKRRNKLGYHRTSVACGHCRRRKIRCLLAPEDPQGKCQNCTRLKKDCVFFPVEQQADVDERPRSDSKLDHFSAEAGTSNSSSPSFTGSRVAEHLDDAGQRLQEFPSSGVHQDGRALGSLSRSLTTPASRGQLSAHTQDTLPPYEQNAPWTASFIEQSRQSLAMDRAPAEELPYWRHGPTMPTSYLPHTYPVMPSSASVAHPSQASMAPMSNSGHGNFHSWSASPHPPLRSLSLGGPDELPAHYQNQYYHSATNEFRPSTNTSDLQPPPLSSHNATLSGSDPSLSVVQNMAFFHDSSAPDVNYPYPSSWSSAPPNQSPQMSGPGSNRLVHGWYSDPPALAQVKEEEAGSQFHHLAHPDNLAYQANPG